MDFCVSKTFVCCYCQSKNVHSAAFSGTSVIDGDRRCDGCGKLYLVRSDGTTAEMSQENDILAVFLKQQKPKATDPTEQKPKAPDSTTTQVAAKEKLAKLFKCGWCLSLQGTCVQCGRASDTAWPIGIRVVEEELKCTRFTGADAKDVYQDFQGRGTWGVEVYFVEGGEKLLMKRHEKEWTVKAADILAWQPAGESPYIKLPVGQTTTPCGDCQWNYKRECGEQG